MKKFLRRISWVNSRGKINWDDILIDIIVVSIISLIIIAVSTMVGQ